MRASLPVVLSLVLASVGVGCAGAGEARKPLLASAPAPAFPSMERPALPAPRRLALRPGETTVEAIGTSLVGTHVTWFERFEGKAHFSPDDATPSQLELHLDMRTLTMATAGLTKDVRSPVFFDVERFPRCDFVSTAVTRNEGSGSYHVKGLLELHGVSQPVDFDIAVVRGDAFTTARAELTFKRHDFGLVFGSPYEGLANEVITVKLWAQDSVQ